MAQDQTEPSAIAKLRARTVLIQDVRARLIGAGLEVRELTDELVITNPGNPENGSYHVTFARGEVSFRRTIWDYLGYLEGYGTGDPDAEPEVTAATIIEKLTGRNREPS